MLDQLENLAALRSGDEMFGYVGASGGRLRAPLVGRKTTDLRSSHRPTQKDRPAAPASPVPIA